MKDKVRNPWLILVLLAVAQFMVVLDTSIVNVALPALQSALHFSPTALQWVVTAYTLTFGGFLLLGGRAADLYGRRKMFLTGAGLFALASLADGLAQSSGQLIALRALQGLAGALMSPAALSIVLITFKEGSERNKALSIWGAVASGGAAAGMLLGGILTQYAGWRWNFFINVPIAATVIFMGLRVLPKHESEAQHNNLDLPGAVSVTGATMSLVYGLTQAPVHGWGAAATLSYFIASALLLIFFVFNEQRAKHPLIDLSIFKVRNVTGANFIQLMIAASLFSVFYFMSLYSQNILRYSPVKMGLSVLVIPIAIAIAATNAPKLSMKVGYKRILMTAPLLLVASLLYLARVPVAGNYWADVFPAYVLMGFGLGFTFVSTTIAATSGVKPTQAGLASGLVNTAQQVGGSLGLGVLAAVASSSITHKFADVMRTHQHLTANDVTVHGYHAAFYVAALFPVLAVIAATFVLHHAKGGSDPLANAEPVAIV